MAVAVKEHVVRSIFQGTDKSTILLNKTHLWIYLEEENVVEIVSVEEEEQHSYKWGERAWNIELRGYFYEKEGIITVHTSNKYNVTKIEKKILRAFDDAGLAILYAKWA